jgi:hypothetical protein
LKDAVEKEHLIAEELKALPEQSNLRKLVTEQTHLLEEILTLLNSITFQVLAEILQLIFNLTLLID